MGWREARDADNGFTWSEQYRHECEVRMVAAMKPRERRRNYMEGVRKVRGPVAWERLARDLEMLWGKRKTEQGGPVSPDESSSASTSGAGELGEQPPACGSFHSNPRQGNSNRDGFVDSEGWA